ncbi:TonB-dependent receptor [Ideonella dechloratans]|uniref:TonB-dependent receptor n=1 Tax=Ideonella dechloratans TaxID=36863 RepID=A0A643F9N9_IDEDE|nr:TonB-dependent receptor [Ideonella dechloratans]KAB0579339.1 TonB-dependent receptor [Ideonella dechloratans]UFU09746.1 TonB-dependent receptor [Ideonella dechloratans]
MARTVSAHRRQRPPATRPRAGVLAVQAALLSLAALPLASQAQSTPDAPQRIEITGSAIKRIDGETALPVQVITREEIDKAGLTTASEIVARLSASAANLTDGGSMSYGGFRDQTGFNGANLRGLGVSSTLVLLNGRRMANFASPGDASGVDLNSIPAAAIDRVEVLLDGASSLYGSDAIGGVINFITRRDYQGAEVNVSYGDTTEGGGGKRTASLAGGFGDYGRDGFNVFGVVDLQRTNRLNASQRQFITDLKIPERLPDLLSSATFPGNIRLSSDQRDMLIADGYSSNGHTVIDSKTINPAAATGCNPPATLYLPDGIGGVDGCTYDYMRAIELYPQSEKTSVFGRGVLDLGGGHQAFFEASIARASTHYSGTPNRIDADMDVSLVPALAGTSLASLPAGDENRVITVRTRLAEAGLRTNELVSTAQRYVAGLTGTLADWDYEVGLNHSLDVVSDRDQQGYLNEQMIRDGFADGTLNPFGASDAAGLALYEAAQIRGEVRRSVGMMDSIDARVSRPLMKLEGGDLALALGSEFRRERQRFHQSQPLADDVILGETSQGTEADFGHARNVAALFTEVNAPVTRQVEITTALRYEKYQGTGSATSPKLGLKYQPLPELALRASAGKGFRAPSMSDLYRPVTEGTAATLVDPVCMAQDPSNTVTDCSDTWTTYEYSNAKLKPEYSRQFSLGAVMEPSRHLNVSVDYWSIQKSNLISTLGADVILANLDKYGSLVHRDGDGWIDHIDLVKENRGKQRISGLDLEFNLKGIETGMGTFGLRLNGTWTLNSKQQTGDGDPYVSNLGHFVNDGVVQRWRHTLSLDWEQGPYSATLSNSYLSGYTDQTIVGKPDRRVGAYTLWDLTGAWTVTEAFTVRGGVKNLFDTAPPFSQQAWFFISGYDPSYTDPRGRFLYVGAQYKFK